MRYKEKEFKLFLIMRKIILAISFFVVGKKIKENFKIKAANIIGHFLFGNDFHHLRRTEKMIQNNNIVILHEIDGNIIEYPKVQGLEIIFSGQNSKVELYAPTWFSKCKLQLSSNSCVVIESPAYEISDLVMYNAIKDSEFVIEKDCSIGGCTIVMGTNTKIRIGEGCMFSCGIEIRTTDGHPIYQKNTKELINNSKDVNIGEHCWIGRGVTILKNVSIPSDTVVGACSVVSKSFNENNTVIAGNPAKVVKRDIDWDRCCID